MANQSALRQIELPEAGQGDVSMPRDARQLSTDELVRDLLKASNSNEIAAVIGLPPIKGISGPKVFY